ncbi:MAG: MarR family transcriptional regulator [Flavobacteriaceae bacterium]|nr:MarR family transcriptional regulator [Flavobacteriaceae bacterium]
MKNTVIGILKAASKAEFILEEVLKLNKLSLQQFNVLRILRDRKNKISNLNTIQVRMIYKMSNTSRLIDKLIDKKLVKRNPCKENRRKVEIVITEMGLSVLSNLDHKIENAEKKILDPLDNESQKKLRKLLNKINLIKQ